MAAIALAVAAAMAGAGCAGGPHAGRGVRTIDLLSLFEYAETRSDTLDLEFLLSRPLFHDGWVRDPAKAKTPTLWVHRLAATLRVPFATTAAKELHVAGRCNPAHGPRLLTLVSLNGHPIGTLPLTPTDEEYSLALPPGAQVPGENELRFEALVEHPPRRHTLALISLSIRPAGDAGPASAPGRLGRALWLPEGSSLSYYLRQDARSRLRLRARAASGRARLAVSVAGRCKPTSLAALDLRGSRTLAAENGVPCRRGSFFRLDLLSSGGGSLVEELALDADEAPAPSSVPLPGRPNVIVFLEDALRADYLGAYGHAAPTSPRFDAFAREAVLFEHASAQSSWTRPCVASLFTGLGVDAHGVGGLTNVLVPEITTLAEALQSAGYRTGAFVGNSVLNPSLGFDQGFGTWDLGLRDKPSTELVRATLDWIGSGTGPVFAYVHTLDPHRPYAPPPEYWRPFLFEGYRGIRNPAVLLTRRNLAPAELRFVRSAYEGEILETDAAFGALLDGLRSRGLLERTVILFTADHGEEFYDHGGEGHSGTLYREVLRIPFVLRLPGGRNGGRRVATPVQQIDAAPTILALAGVRAPAEMEGRDLSASCADGDVEAAPALLLSGLDYAQAKKVAVRSGAMKLIVNLEPGVAADARLELYDLERDPRETRNLAAEQPLVARYLYYNGAALRAAQHALRGRLKAGRERPITPEDAEQLRALGYIH